MPSEFQRKQKELEERRCTGCYGRGEQNDCFPGDISYNTWTCRVCKGTGLKPTTKE